MSDDTMNPTCRTEDELRAQVTRLMAQVDEFASKIQYLINHYVPTDMEGCFTFPDGDSWFQTASYPRDLSNAGGQYD